MENLLTAKKRRLNSWVVTLSLAAAAVVFYFAVFRPTEKRMAELRLEIDEKRQFIQSTDMLQLTINEVDADAQNAIEFVSTSRTAAPTEQQLPDMYRDINALMKTHQVLAERFDPGEPIPMNTLMQAPLSLAASGSFAQVFELISSLDKLPGPTWIDNLTLTSQSRNPGTVSIEANLVIFTDNSKNSD